MGQKLGKEVLFDYINKFGFGKKTGIDLNGEASGILFNLDRVGPVKLATNAFGRCKCYTNTASNSSKCCY